MERDRNGCNHRDGVVRSDRTETCRGGAAAPGVTDISPAANRYSPSDGRPKPCPYRRSAGAWELGKSAAIAATANPHTTDMGSGLSSEQGEAAAATVVAAAASLTK